jgi:hypothetical protein
MSDHYKPIFCMFHSAFGPKVHLKWPFYHGMARCRVADGGDGLQLWMIDRNI